MYRKAIFNTDYKKQYTRIIYYCNNEYVSINN